MPFKFKLSVRLALMKDALLVGLLAATGCEKPIALTGPSRTVLSVSVSPATVSLFTGTAAQLTATPKDSAGNSLSGTSITWSSDNGSVASVSGAGLVTGMATGGATITATSEGKSATALITVTDVPVASVALSPSTGALRTGGTQQLSATTKDSAGNALAGRVVTWGSSNTGVATVSTSGLVTGKAVGTATITATSEGKSATAAITVTAVPVASVALSPSSATLAPSATQQLTATTKDSTGTVLTGRVVTWASTPPAVATVSASGLVTGVSAGTATITATSEGKSGTAAITVQSAPPPTGSVPDPTLLPAASGQVPNLAAYVALNVPAQPAGFSYNDP